MTLYNSFLAALSCALFLTGCCLIHPGLCLIAASLVILLSIRL